MKFYVAEKLGNTQSLTPEGYLLCEAVPINRTGEYIYGPGETTIPVDGDGVTRISRSEEEVFRPETIASFQGKPVVDDHPSDDVSPQSWRALAVGVVLNPRRGVGAMDDVLLADLLITDHTAIQKIGAGKREVSCGYDAEYEPLGPGRGRQKNIIGNHVALVDSGRCGPRCAIGDSAATSTRRPKMKLKDRILAAFKSGKECDLNAALEDLKEDGTASVVVNVHDSKTRDAEKEKEDEEKEERKKTEDAMRDSVFADARFKEMKDTVDKVASTVADIKKSLDAKKDDEEEEEEGEKARDDENRKIEGDLEEEAPPGTGDKAAKAKDSAYMAESFQQTVAAAEIIAPGISAPTFDSKAKPVDTYKAVCSFRRRALDHVYQFHEPTHIFMTDLLQGRKLEGMNCAQVRDTFRAVVGWRKSFNNRNNAGGGTADTTRAFGSGVTGSLRSAADINKANADFYAKQ